MRGQVTPISPVSRQLADFKRGDQSSLLQLLNETRNIIVNTQVQDAWNVKTMFGAFGDGSHDDTAAIQLAHDTMPASGGAMYLPPGTYLVSGTITFTKPVTLIGAGLGSSILSTNSATLDLLVLNGTFQRVTGVQFTTTTARTAGAYVHCQSLASRTTLDNLLMLGWFCGVQWDGLATLDIDNCYILNGAAGTGIGALFSGAINDGTIRRLLVDNPAGSQPSAGILLNQCGDLVISDSNVIHCVSGLSVAPGAGQVVASLWVHDSFFDNCSGRCVVLKPTNATGNILRCRFANCWASSAGAGVGIGFHLDGSIGPINGVDIVNLHAFLNVASGLQIGGANTKNVHVNGGEFAQNGGDGITIGAVLTDFSVLGVRSGNTGGLLGNTGWGINVPNAANTNYRVIANDTRGNTTGGLNDIGVAPKAVANNL